MELIKNINQLKFSRAYRISAHPLEENLFSDETVKKIEKLIQSYKDQIGNAKPNAIELNFITDVLTGLWRTRKNLLKPGSNEPSSENRMAYRHLQSAWDLFIEKGFSVMDHMGEPVQGRSLTVLSFEPTKGITEEQVIETIKPTIYFKEELLQVADVIAGTPVTE
jgi:hypothetical protein